MTNTLDKLAKIRAAAHNAMWYGHPDGDDRKEAYSAISALIKEAQAPKTIPAALDDTAQDEIEYPINKKEEGSLTNDRPSPSSRGTSRRPRSARTSDTGNNATDVV